MKTNYLQTSSPGRFPEMNTGLVLLAIIILGLVVFTVVSCKVPQQLPVTVNNKDSSHTEVKYVDRNVPVFIPADTSAWMQALIECDSMGIARLTDLQKQFGRKAEAALSIKKNVVRAKCIVDSQTVYLKVKDRYETNNSVKSTETLVPYPVEKQLTWWQQFKVNYGGYAIGSWIGLIVGIIVMVIIKIYLKVQIPFLK